MTTIKDILQLNLNEDLKDVIDLEDREESHLKYEIENYIVTEKIAGYLDKIINLYKSNIKETGIWLSGFYGSGKSYFGKMLGYLLENRIIEGTKFRERYIQRLSGLHNQSLLENAIRGLNAYQSKVVFLDIAKQNTKNGFAWVLFKNFLRTLGFLDDVFGYMEYSLFLENKYDQFLEDVKRIHGKEWHDVRRNAMSAARVMRNTLTKTIYTEDEYGEIKQSLDDRIKDYDTTRFKEELSYYLEKFPEERLVFIIDEVSEAISREKIDLLELEGISEALSAIPRGRVWTIAIAQEKLDDVIYNANVRKQDLNKVTDRFKTKIHLSNEEVDVVVRKRLLLKKEEATKTLSEYYSKNSGLIADATTLNGTIPTKTEKAEDFVTYYPFHKYQFELVQNFLFAVNRKAKTGGTIRGMVIASNVVLKEIKNESLFNFVSADKLVDGAKKLIESELETKFIKADKILESKKSPLSGMRLMKVIHLLNEAEIIASNAEVIAKLYLTQPKKYYEIKPDVEQVLKYLVDANLIIEKKGLYKIASDLEQKLIEEIKEITVEFHYKKRELVEALKNLPFLNLVAKCTFEGNPYSFHVTTVDGDELQYSTNKYIKFQLASSYTVEIENKDAYIEKIKFETQSDIDRAVLIPSMDEFDEINHLIENIYRYSVIIERYKNDDDERIRSIVKDFDVNLATYKKELNHLIEKSYKNGVLIYHFEEHTLTDSDFSRVVQDIQHKIIARTYTDRLPYQLSEEIAKKILKETNPAKLKTYFSGAEFQFFDNSGNFVGDHLKVVEKITGKMPSTSFINGEELEKELSLPPYAYAYGTVVTVLAVLMRSGRLALKSNTGITTYDYKRDEAWNVFSRSRDFRKAAFKIIASTLSLAQKRKIVDQLKELSADRILNREFSYSANNIELISLVSDLARYFIERVEERRDMLSNFDRYFPQTEEFLNQLKPFAGKITDANYQHKAETFLEQYQTVKQAVSGITEILHFADKKLSEAKKYREFVQHIVIELKKLGGAYQNNPIFALQKEFDGKFDTALIENFDALKTIYQKIKDEYYRLMKAEHETMSAGHKELAGLSDQKMKQVQDVSADLNQELLAEIEEVKRYAQRHVCPELKIEYEIACQNCHFTLNEIIAANQSLEAKKALLDQVALRIKYPEQGGEKLKTKTIKLKARTGRFTVGQYRCFLSEELDKIEPLNDDDIIEVE